MRENTAEKLKKIQSLFDAGKNHAEIAKELGYNNIKSYYRYIYQHDEYLRYTKQYDKKGMHVVKNKEIPHKEDKVADIQVEAVFTPKDNLSKAELIVEMLETGADIREVAKKKHFKDTQELANFMSSKGYIWNTLKKNYVISLKEEMQTTEIEAIREVLNEEQHNTPENLDEYSDILRFISNNKDKLNQLLRDEQTGKFPRYILPRKSTNKTFIMADTLVDLIMEYADEFNITQKEILEIAVIEFFKKYGFKDELKSRLNI